MLPFIIVLVDFIPFNTVLKFASVVQMSCSLSSSMMAGSTVGTPFCKLAILMPGLLAGRLASLLVVVIDTP